MSAVPFDPNLLLNYGVLGIVLAWFMFRLEKIIKNNTAATNALVARIELLCSNIGVKIDTIKVREEP